VPGNARGGVFSWLDTGGDAERDDEGESGAGDWDVDDVRDLVTSAGDGASVRWQMEPSTPMRYETSCGSTHTVSSLGSRPASGMLQSAAAAVKEGSSLAAVFWMTR
jgi:hypothetical protein